MDLSLSIKKRIGNDCDFPVPVPEHFNYYYTLYGYLFDMQQFLGFAQDVFNKLSNEGFFEEFDKIKNQMVEDVINKPEYIEFNTCPIDKIYPLTINFQNRKLFHPDNHGKEFISFDMRQANFQALRYHNPVILDKCKDYYQFISQFTEYDYFRTTKRIRQVLFGHTNPKRLHRIQTHLVAGIALKLQNEIFTSDTDLSRYVTASNDEIVIELHDGEYEQYIHSINSLIESEQIKYKVTHFTLKQMKPHGFYVKVIPESYPDFKCVPSYLFPQVYKRYFGIEVQDIDLHFIYENSEAKFINKLEFEE